MRATELIRFCIPMVLTRCIFKKYQFWRPPKRGHFSCRKSVSHERTSTVSDSEALIHLAYVQHLWQSKLVVILEGLTRWRIALCSEMQLARKWLQMHFDMRVCLLEKILLCSFESKNFCKFCTIFGPQNGGWKMDPKMVQNLQKFLLSKLRSKFFSSKQTRISKCICSHFLASCISEHNAILHLVKPSKITTSFDCHKCCTWAGWIRASESDTVEVLSCETDFLHETWPRFGGRQSWPFCQIGSLKGLHQRCNWFMHFWRAQGPSLGFFTRFSFRFGLHFHVSFVLDCSKKCLAGVAVWRSVLLRPCLSNLFLGRWLP